MLTYSIAIRTLGTSGEVFREELLSITRQTIQPERVLIYIAEGFFRPEYTIGREEYVWVKKGMVAQRILPYDEITSDVIFLLDDDVRLAPDSAERMLKAMEEYKADCVGADTFKNHNMPVVKKIYAALTNFVFPHWSNKWAFKIHYNGSFSYNNRPTKSFYWSQSCAGNAVMLRMSIYRQLHFEDELWLDDMPFAYNDDMVESYKIYKNGFRLGVLYDAGCEHLNVCSASTTFRKGSQWVHTRTMAMFIIWWRTIYQTMRKNSLNKLFVAFYFIAKIVWLSVVMCGASIVKFTPQYTILYINGLIDGWQFVHSDRFFSLRKYVVR